MNRRELLDFLAAAGAVPAATLLTNLGHSTSEKPHRAMAAQLDPAAVEQIETVLDAFARQYEAFGPKAVLAVRQNQAELIDSLLADCPASLLPRLLSVRATLARSLGWTCYDAGNLHAAGYHYALARNAAHEAADASSTALVLCNMSLAATRGGRAGIGVDHAAAAAYWAQRSPDRYLLAYSRDMAAEAHAELGQTAECRTALDEAREIIETNPSTELPSYVYDPALNAGFAAECLTKLGVGELAVTAAKRSVELIDPSYALSRGFADIGLGNALCLTGQADQAAHLIAHTATTAANYGSPRLAGEVKAARNSLYNATGPSTATRTVDTVLAAPASPEIVNKALEPWKACSVARVQLNSMSKCSVGHADLGCCLLVVRRGALWAPKRRDGTMPDVLSRSPPTLELASRWNRLYHSQVELSTVITFEDLSDLQIWVARIRCFSYFLSSP